MFSSEFCESFKKTFIYRTPPDDCFWRYEMFFFSVFPFLKKKLTFKSNHWELFCKKAVLRFALAWEIDVLWIVKNHGTMIKLSALLKFCLLAWDIDVFWIKIWRTNSKHPGKIRYCCRYLQIFLGKHDIPLWYLTFFFFMVNKFLSTS